MKAKVVIVDDDRSLRELLSIVLAREGYDVVTYADGREAIENMDSFISSADVVLTDIVMPQMDGIVLLQEIKKASADLPVIVITANTKHDYAVEALRQGAHDYITKPFQNDELKIIIKNAIEKRNILKENTELKSFLRKDETSIIFRSRAMEDLYFKAVSVAKTSVPALITGESGTGKELFARLIHRESDRSTGPFFAVNCAAIPENLIESEFFGFEKGAFTGASAAKPGFFELAHRGILFLDEVGDLPLPVQSKLLRALEEKAVLRLGGKEPVDVDVRIVTATNKNLDEEVRKGMFREDLFYRMNVVSIILPPLRERKEDIMPLAIHFLRKFCLSCGKRINGFTKDAVSFLEEYAWPGNVRELQNVIDRAGVFESGDIIGVGSLPVGLISSITDASGGIAASEGVPNDFTGFNLDVYLRNVERRLIEHVLAKTGGNKRRAAQMLGVSLWSLYHRIDKDKKE